MAEGDDDEIQNMTDDEFERRGRDVAHNTTCLMRQGIWMRTASLEGFLLPLKQCSYNV